MHNERYEATASLTTQPKNVHTPLSPAEGAKLSESAAIIPILRAGLGEGTEP